MHPNESLLHAFHGAFAAGDVDVLSLPEIR
ncbi:MAG: hypothetical protein ACJA2W_003077 [Planctomycetota bacterium]|jgi:hypothetical protein